MENQPPHPAPPRRNPKWRAFALVLLAPILLSCLAGALDARNGGAAPIIALLGGGLGGIIAGAILGRHLGRTPGLGVLFGILFAGGLAVACIGASCFGCLASGYQMSFH